MMKTWIGLGVLAAALVAQGAQERIFFSDFEKGTPPVGWRMFSANKTIPVVSSGHAFSGTKSLALVDKNADEFGAWGVDGILLSDSVREAGWIQLKAQALYRIDGVMRLTFSFFDAAGERIDMKHVFLRGKSAGWDDGDFSELSEKVSVPATAASVRMLLMSGGPSDTTGEVYFDDVALFAPSAQKLEPGEPFPAANRWDMERGSLIRENCPEGWERSGALPYLARWADGALCIADNDERSHGLWCTERTALNGFPEQLDLGFRLKPEKMSGVWKVSVHYYPYGVEHNYSQLMYRVDGVMEMVGDNLQIRWEAHDAKAQSLVGSDVIELSSADADGFVSVSGRLPVPERAKSLRVSFMSGWEPEATGTVWVDDVTVGY